MKLGMIGETVVNLMFRYDHIPAPYDNTAVTRIDTLYREGIQIIYSVAVYIP